MFSNRILLMRPALYTSISPQVRAFSLARVALEPARKVAPPPPPPPAPARGRKPTAAATAKATTTTAAKKPAAKSAKAAPVVAAPTRTRLTEQERAARDKDKDKDKEKLAKIKEREKLAKVKEREKLAKAKERVKEREKALKAKEREKELEKKEKAKAREELKKEREKTKIKVSEAIKKPYPPPPKGPRTSYLMFTTDTTVNRDRGEGVAEDAMVASQAWKALSETERDVYRKKYEKARVAWKEEVAKWVASLNLAQLMAARANREPGTREGAALDVLPKRPGNAYALFLTDMTNRQDFRDKVEALAQQEGAKDDKELAKKRISLYGRTSADIWKSMSDKEKEVYTNKAVEAKEQWDKNFGHLIAAQKEEISAAVS